MSETIIKVENLSKLYRLGEIGTGTLSQVLNRWWAQIRGKEDPFADWRLGPIMVDDGGSWFWQILYDHSTRKCLKFAANVNA